jgi:hypothetical protein
MGIAPELFRVLSREHVRLGPPRPRRPRGRDRSIINEAWLGRCDKQHWRKFDLGQMAQILFSELVVLHVDSGTLCLCHR